MLLAREMRTFIPLSHCSLDTSYPPPDQLRTGQIQMQPNGLVDRFTGIALLAIAPYLPTFHAAVRENPQPQAAERGTRIRRNMSFRIVDPAVLRRRLPTAIYNIRR
ncbi:hypothetical protein LMG27177_07239 [Paraburkholderia fynbosensis]|uniref:Uncharacterized protein n=1 Tax=Paraburkholderia fynbosensis TaxID=1200993 RepID=A0A6J5H4S6_9BURK|nr:hypothetical protein LMG27177_07239 [Paraburkholderia fynbosensis]